MRSDQDQNHNVVPQDLSNYQVALAGDLVINKMKAWQGSMGLAPVDGIVSPAYFVFESDFSVPAFGEYLLRSKPYVARFAAASDGVRVGQWDLSVPRLREIEVRLPPPEEQAAIVKYLAHATARIDKAIASKRRLVYLLEEESEAQRAALFETLETSQRLGSVLWEGPTNGVSPAVSEQGDLETFSISAIRRGKVDVRRSDIKHVDRASVRDVGKYRLEAGDVLLVRGNGNIELVGRAGLVTENMTDRVYPDLLMRMRFHPNVVPGFIVAALGSPSARRQIESTARTAVGTFKLSGADVRSVRVPVPEPCVQRKILGGLAVIEARRSRATEKLLEEIALLEEFRTRLVADVVTGQVDVRGVAASLPDALTES